MIAIWIVGFEACRATRVWATKQAQTFVSPAMIDHGRLKRVSVLDGCDGSMPWTYTSSSCTSSLLNLFFHTPILWLVSPEDGQVCILLIGRAVLVHVSIRPLLHERVVTTGVAIHSSYQEEHLWL